ncbi:UDP-4-amino-4,6-dideoxy-N-acetyl-beta-L-altrosamine transaminase [Candidatus Marithrix sp. Canyon 246]|uniref:UDP-4-amino-4, 6-dideoxy-N-acetyl-beta-L-altrosamine transaminase n=1 Tax=Candidatus Marithrix sp. Canyon 246 TaxID=1827136 RepID=UPI00084A038B|nr:UDP-4-amino-4,6-dideoxy-N-acetyl-beta-L-altrosamine transaminase [Candidatus Marithrix sp. Canyon 246]
MIPYGRQDISQTDIDAVVEVLRSDWITQGPTIARFEQAVANYCGSQYAVAVCNATAALHLACRAIGLGVGDRLWTSPNTFVASANCGLYCGAEVDFVDIDPQTYNISIDALRAKLEQAEKVGKLPKVLIPVHFAGQSCEMATIAELAKQYGFYVIEDASHAIGGEYKGKKIGNCSYSDMTVFSFHPVKIITTGEGGMVVTNNPELFEKVSLLRTHGITRTPSQGAWYYQQVELGYNYRITDIQAALGLSQMQRLDSFINQRHELVQTYNDSLKDLPLQLPWQHPDSYSAWHLYVIRLNKRSQVFDSLREAGIGVNVHYIPVHTQPYYQEMGFKIGDFPEAEKYYDQVISLPIYPLLTETEQQKVITFLKKALL